jgi:hypothetical protein
VAVEGQARIVGRHPTTIVRDRDPGGPAVADLDPEPFGPGVHRVLYEFLGDRCGALDDLAGRDLVDQRVREHLDASSRAGRKALCAFDFAGQGALV